MILLHSVKYYLNRRMVDRGYGWIKETDIPKNLSTKELHASLCDNKVVLRGFNDLATTNPEILALWSDLNGALKPKDIRASYHKQVWWKCPVCDNEYQAQPKTVIGKAKPGCKNCTTTVGRRWKEHPRR